MYSFKNSSLDLEWEPSYELKVRAPRRKSLRLLSKDLLTGEELGKESIEALLDLALELKKRASEGFLSKSLLGKHVALIFDKPSLRTRFSFTVGVHQLGGHVIESAQSTRKTETPEDTAKVLAGYCDAIMIRTYRQQDIHRMAMAVDIPVINGLSDTHHPCQILADLMTLKERVGHFDGFKLSYVGDGNNILHSILLMMPLLGIDVHYACPQGSGPDAQILRRAKLQAQMSGSQIYEFEIPEEAVKGTHAIYTDVWTSMGFEESHGDRTETFKTYQVNRALVEKAEKNALIMHCLPMQRGLEITSEIADDPCSVIFDQSENRLHAQKALLYGLMGRS